VAEETAGKSREGRPESAVPADEGDSLSWVVHRPGRPGVGAGVNTGARWFRSGTLTGARYKPGGSNGGHHFSHRVRKLLKFRSISKNLKIQIYITLIRLTIGYIIQARRNREKRKKLN
jgi:hypothetical protein